MSRGRETAELLASTAVLAMGFCFCLMLIIIFAEDVRWPLTILCGATALVALMPWLNRRDKTSANSELSFWARFRKPVEPVINYEPRKARGRRRTTENQPPSAEELREMRDSSLNTWVPSRTRTDPEQSE